jgi:hypothetical protein
VPGKTGVVSAYWAHVSITIRENFSLLAVIDVPLLQDPVTLLNWQLFWHQAVAAS